MIIRTTSALVVLVLGAACTPATSSETPSTPAQTATGGRSASGGAPGSGGSSSSGSGGSSATGGGGTTTGSSGGGGSGSGGAGVASGGAGGDQPSGGSGGSSAQPDAPMAGDSAGAGGSPSTPAGCTGKFCDDFEAFAVGGPPGGDWTTTFENGGKLAVDETRAFSGARSVHFTHNGSMEFLMFMNLGKPLLPLPTPVVYGRLMYYLAKNPTGTFSHFELVRGGGPLAGGGTAQLNTGAENGKAFVNYEPGDCSAPAPAVPFPEKEWACYQFAFDGSKNQIIEWVNGKMAAGPTAPKGQCWKWPMAVDAVHIGWSSYHTPVLIDLWIDDVAVGDQPIPCPTGMPSKP